MRIRRPASLTALLAAAALIGCGGSDEPTADETQAAYSSLQTRIKALGASIGREIQAAAGQTDAALERAFASLEQRGEEQVQQLGDLEVPDDLVEQRDALRDAIDRGTADLGDIVTAVRESDPAAAQQAVQALVTDSQAIGTAREAFEQALDDATR